MRDATLCFLVKRNSGVITEICLAMKKRGFAEGKWNGVGGKVDSGESIEKAMIRETMEEIAVQVNDYTNVATIEFNFPDDPEIGQKVHVYLTESWSGDPRETEEMRPKWYNVQEIPYDKMWVDDQYWLPLILADKSIEAHFELTTDNKILGMNIKEMP